MRLNQYHKDAIYRAIAHDIPRTKPEVLLGQINDAIYKGMSKECRALFRKNPKAIRSQYISSVNLDYNQREIPVGDADWKTILKPFEAEESKRGKILMELKNAINGCSTRKQFIDRFPEFSNYAPPVEGVSENLPAVANVVAGLISIGFVPKVTKPENK